MNIVIIICLVLVTISIIVATVFFVIAMIRISETSKKAEQMLTDVNNDIESVRSFYKTVIDIGNTVPGMAFKILMNFIPKVKTFVCKKKSSTEEHNG